MKFNYGRFAPSPSGPLHFGSLIAALGSFLIAKTSGAKWLVRIEDIDPPREIKGASETILKQLESHALHWDGDILYQSQRLDYYQSVLDELLKKDLVYGCDCTRKQIKEFRQQNPSPANTGSGLQLYPNICQDKNLDSRQQVALRLRHGQDTYSFEDMLQGTCEFDNALYREDFTVKRKDGLIAYQLAVVLDDIEQNIDHVVRGCDLLDSTPRQIRLYQVLQAQAPQFVHLPLVINQDGNKLSKQNHAQAIEPQDASSNLVKALSFLGQLEANSELCSSLEHSSPDSIIEWALAHFDFDKIPTIQAIS